MTEPRFHLPARELSVAEIAELTGAAVHSGAADGRIAGVAALDHAGPRDLAFLDNPRYAPQLVGCAAGVLLLAPRFAEQAPAGAAVLVTRQPYRDFVTVARELFPDSLRPSSLFAAADKLAPGAFLHAAARLEADVRIDPGAVVGPDAEIGAGSVVAAGAVIGPGVRVGRGCSIGAGATLTHALIGDRVVVHPGVRIGQDGFGYLPSPNGHLKVPQVGRVIIQDRVEIGANTTIDRGANRDTVIGEGTKIDNLVQIGHNVEIGRHCLIVAQTGLSGSVTVGDFVVLGARVGVNNHVRIGEGAQIAAISVVNDDVPPGARWGGTPAKPLRLWFREMKLLEQMARGPRARGPADSGRESEER